MTSRENAEYGARRRGLKGAAKRKWIEDNTDVDADPVLPMTGKADESKPKPKTKANRKA